MAFGPSPVEPDVLVRFNPSGGEETGRPPGYGSSGGSRGSRSRAGHGMGTFVSTLHLVVGAGACAVLVVTTWPGAGSRRCRDRYTGPVRSPLHAGASACDLCLHLLQCRH